MTIYKLKISVMLTLRCGALNIDLCKLIRVKRFWTFIRALGHAIKEVDIYIFLSPNYHSAPIQFMSYFGY